jgi:hypothetical protein
MELVSAKCYIFVLFKPSKLVLWYTTTLKTRAWWEAG